MPGERSKIFSQTLKQRNSVFNVKNMATLWTKQQTAEDLETSISETFKINIQRNLRVQSVHMCLSNLNDSTKKKVM